MKAHSLTIISSLFLVLFSLANAAEKDANTDERYPFRTDWANVHLPWYQLKPVEFPPHHSDRRISGELVEADFIHRTGQFRSSQGELVNFKMPPHATISYLNAEASLQDIPLGTRFLFFLNQDRNGNFTQLATMQDEYSMLANHRFSYRLDEVKAGEGKLLVTKQSLPKNQPDLGKSELRINDNTRIWKGDKQIKLDELAIGDELLINTTGGTPSKPVRCTDVWAGAETHQKSTEQQQKRHHDYLRKRGIPAWIEAVDDKLVTVSLLGDQQTLQALFKADEIDPQKWVKERRRMNIIVANEDLRTYTPNVDTKGCIIQEILPAASDVYGSAGQRWLLKLEIMLEGFRKGRNVRLFIHPSWKMEDMPFGEGLYVEVPAEETRDLMLEDYPFRTDFMNENLPWYTLKRGEFPPYRSEHRVSGELVKADSLHRKGQFKKDDTGELIDFTLLPYGYAKHVGTEATLEDIPLGTRCLFFLHLDEKGEHTKASVIMDEFTYLYSNQVSYRVIETNLKEGSIVVGRQIAQVKNYQKEMVQPPDIGRSILNVDAATKVWKGSQQIKLDELAIGDEILENFTGRNTTDRGRCTNIWIGKETQENVLNQQRGKFQNAEKIAGLPGLIDTVDGNRITVTFFSSNRDEFRTMMRNTNKVTQYMDAKVLLNVSLVDDELKPISSNVEKMRWQSNPNERPPVETFGCSDVRWTLQNAGPLPKGYQVGQLVRIVLTDEPK